MYGEFENKQLQSGQEYVVFVLAVVETSENVRLIYRWAVCEKGPSSLEDTLFPILLF